jgi:hypothetical protein
MKKNEEKLLKDLLGLARHCIEVRRQDTRSMNEDVLLRNLIMMGVNPVGCVTDIKSIKM